MKPEEEREPEGTVEPELPSGDVIGNTAYSERFVLKILLKLSNLDTLKDEVKDPAFEESLCTLWDMTAEKDVVFFMKKHIAFELFSFALPAIESNRITEIILGIMGNMCCYKELADQLLTMDDLLVRVLDHLRSDDCPTLNQMLRLVNSCLYLASEEDIDTWMNKFKNIGYADALYFILRNSANKELLITAIENFNTICTYCNIEPVRETFFSVFVSWDAYDALFTGYNELMLHHFDGDELGRLSIVALHITMQLVTFTKTPQDYLTIRTRASDLVKKILLKYEDKITDLPDFDIDLIDVLEMTYMVISKLEMCEISDPEKFFMPCYKIWKTIANVVYTDAVVDEFDNLEKNKYKEYYSNIKGPLCGTLGSYMAESSPDDLLIALKGIGSDYDVILNDIADIELKEKISSKSANFRSRLEENVDA